MFNLYVQTGMNERASGVLTTLQREIGREQVRASVAPTVQEEVEIQQKVDELKELKRVLEQSLGEDE